MLLTSAGSALSVELSSAEWVVVGSIPAIGPIKGLKITDWVAAFALQMPTPLHGSA